MGIKGVELIKVDEKCSQMIKAWSDKIKQPLQFNEEPLKLRFLYWICWFKKPYLIQDAAYEQSYKNTACLKLQKP